MYRWHVLVPCVMLGACLYCRLYGDLRLYATALDPEVLRFVTDELRAVRVTMQPVHA